MADSTTLNSTTEREVHTPHSTPESVRVGKSDQGFSAAGGPKTPHSALTESDERPSRVLAVLDWLKERNLVPPGFATEPMPSLVEVIEHVRQTAEAKTDSPWGRAFRMAWAYLVGIPTTCLGYLLAWSSWFAARLLFVTLVSMSVMSLLQWIPLVHWLLAWMSYPYWWHRLTGW